MRYTETKTPSITENGTEGFKEGPNQVPHDAERRQFREIFPVWSSPAHIPPKIDPESFHSRRRGDGVTSQPQPPIMRQAADLLGPVIGPGGFGGGASGFFGAGSPFTPPLFPSLLDR